MAKRFVMVGAIAVALVVLAVVFTPVRGQMARGVTVICSGCDVPLLSLRDGRAVAGVPSSGVVLRNDATGELWFYSLNGQAPRMQKLGTLNEVGKPIVWAMPEQVGAEVR